MYLQGKGTGVGKGKTPMTGIFEVTVTNILTEGGMGDLDFPKSGDGAWDIEWEFVQCPGSSSDSRRMLSA